MPQRNPDGSIEADRAFLLREIDRLELLAPTLEYDRLLALNKEILQGMRTMLIQGQLARAGIVAVSD